MCARAVCSVWCVWCVYVLGRGHSSLSFLSFQFHNNFNVSGQMMRPSPSISNSVSFDSALKDVEVKNVSPNTDFGIYTTLSLPKPNG